MKKNTRIKQKASKSPLVLIIEDEQFLCNLMVKKLMKSSLKVEGRFDGETGFQAVVEKKPDIVLLDLLLPGIDGFEVLRRLKQDEGLKKIPVIILSNLGESKDIDRAMQLGASAYLVKAEHSPEEVVGKVWEFVGKKRN
ncbi:MAG: response regulator [Patescibacteria group bacterium]